MSQRSPGRVPTCSPLLTVPVIIENKLGNWRGEEKGGEGCSPPVGYTLDPTVEAGRVVKKARQ